MNVTRKLASPLPPEGAEARVRDFCSLPSGTMFVCTLKHLLLRAYSTVRLAAR